MAEQADATDLKSVLRLTGGAGSTPALGTPSSQPMSDLENLKLAYNPRAIAIVGASEKSDARWQGAVFIKNLRKAGYQGPIYPVNPNAQDILGLKVYPSLISLPKPVDLAIVSVSCSNSLSVMEDCAAAGIKNIHFFTAGFSETGEEEGKALEARLKELALKNGINLVGPNCMGINVPSAGVVILQGVKVPAGPVAFISQSGGHCLQLCHYAPSAGIGFSKVISFGNAAVLDSTDYLETMKEDGETGIFALYVEGVRDGRRFFRLVREINRSSPVIVWKGGMTSPGSRAALSHTGSLAGDREKWEAFYRQTGAIEVVSLDELADTIMTLLYLKSAPGNGVALLMGGGGHSVTAADFCGREGLEVPLLGEETRRELRKLVAAAGTSIRNPIDAEILLRDMNLFEKALVAISADPRVDIIIVDQHLDMLKEMGKDNIERFGSAILKQARGHSGAKGIAVLMETWGGDSDVAAERVRLQKEFLKNGVPVYRTLPRACRALSKYLNYREFIRRGS